MTDLTAFLRARFDEDERDPGGWSAARVLAEVDAKRRIVAECAHMIRRGEPERSRAEWILRVLAAPHADHPDYQPEWAPEA